MYRCLHSRHRLLTSLEGPATVFTLLLLGNALALQSRGHDRRTLTWGSLFMVMFDLHDVTSVTTCQHHAADVYKVVCEIHPGGRLMAYRTDVCAGLPQYEESRRPVVTPVQVDRL
eukprot:68143-Hanusia_phi.AAC.1